MQDFTESDKTFAKIPQEILDRLTNVEMPRVRGIESSKQVLTVNDHEIPVYKCESLVLGSGAAGMRAAVEGDHRPPGAGR